MERGSGFRRGRGSNHVWTAIEDQKLVETMVELKISGNFDGVNGSGLRKGYQKELEKILEQKLPGHGLKEKPHIESRCKLLKRQYHAIYEVRHGGESSGFGWDDEKKCVTATADVWDAYMKSHPDNSFMRNKSFLYYDQLAIVWGQDRATGKNAEAPADMLEEINRENDRNEEVEESDEDDAETQNTQLPTGDPQGEGSSRKTHRKRKRSADSLVLSLERMTDVLSAHMKENSEQMSKIAEIIVGPDQLKVDNRHKLNEELRKLDGLSDSERHKFRMKLVRDPDLLDYFFTIMDSDKEQFLRETLD